MSTQVRKNTAMERFELTSDGRPVGYIEYQDTGDERAMVHTEIFPEFEGRGFASTLIESALDTSREEGFAILPMCPVVLHFITTHPEYIAFVPQRSRAIFGLPQ
ncbi:GNAT family N-acetyltransferase [Nocardia sp. NPDC058666]|uniref:GNAT family N-acetyltransferase n=1 Tax=unclassified Nocardia TaxID=2637762 RepID=UPI003655423F